MTKSRTPISPVAIVALILAVAAPLILHIPLPHIEIFSPLNKASTLFSPLPTSPKQPNPSSQFLCEPHTYTTEIISLTPLIIYIHNFLSPTEPPHLLQAAEPLFHPSNVTGPHGQPNRPSGRRTSRSAVLPTDDAAARCLVDRALRFLGTMLTLPHDDVQPPQLVRYGPGQRFDVHADWFGKPQPRRADSTGRERGSGWDRPASFLAVLEDGCGGGETWFPYVSVPEAAARGNAEKGEEERSVWRVHEDGGIAVRPVRGNALFWVNLLADGTGDERTRHAGLPVEFGVKTAMNIWPRVYYP